MDIALYFIILAVFCVVFTLEVIAPASGAECDKRWQIYAGCISLVQTVATLAAGIVFRDTFESISLFNLSAEYSAPVVGVVCFFVTSFFAYWWHRWMHYSDLLWRVFHQLHHSPSRVESLTAFYIHPFDGVAATFVNAICAYVIVGASAAGAAWGLLFAGLYNLYIHLDQRSPRWLGFLVQRPEMHRVHHKRDYHASNYGLPVWDLLFGTFENPRERVADCGFDAAREYRIRDMLLMKDVHKADKTAKPISEVEQTP